jgi:hypothetical protein
VVDAGGNLNNHKIRLIRETYIYASRGVITNAVIVLLKKGIETITYDPNLNSILFRLFFSSEH